MQTNNSPLPNNGWSSTSYSWKGCDSLIIHFLWKPKVFTRNEISLSTQYTWQVNNIAIIKAQMRPRSLKKPIMMIMISQNRHGMLYNCWFWFYVRMSAIQLVPWQQNSPKSWPENFSFVERIINTCSCAIFEKWSTSGTDLILNVHRAKI